MNKPLIFSWGTYLPHAQQLAASLGGECVPLTVTKFADGEYEIGPLANIPANIHRVFVVHSIVTYEDFIIAALIAGAIKKRGVHVVTLVAPYFTYARHDRYADGTKPGPVHIMLRMLAAAGYDELVIVELHNPEIIIDAPLVIHHVRATEDIIREIAASYQDPSALLYVAPDRGAYERVREIAEHFDADMIVVEKERIAPDESRISIMNDLSNYTHAIVIDDIISTGGTAVQVAQELQKHGIKNIDGYFVHAVGHGTELKNRLVSAGFNRITVSDTIIREKPFDSSWTVESYLPLLTQYLHRWYIHGSH